MADMLRLGFVGLGSWGTRLAQAAQRSGETAVACGFARSEDAREAFAKEFDCEPAPDLRALLSADIDAVVIATPHTTHAEMVRAAAEAGKHIFVEKPFTLDVASAREAIAAAESSGVVLQVGHQRRRLGATRRLGGLVASGELGTVHLLEATIFNDSGLKRSSSWKFEPAERPLGAMTQLGVHMLDNLQYLAGAARRVTALSKSVLDQSAGEDVTTFLIEYDSGPLGVLSNSAIGIRVSTLVAHGTTGSAWSDLDGTRFLRQDKGDQAPREEPVESSDPLAEQFVDFARCARSGERPEVDGHTALEVVAVLEAGMRSVARGAAVEVDEVRG